MSSKSYRRNIQWSFVGSLATAIFQFAQMAVFARLSGPAALGDYALAATVIGFSTTIAEAGLPQSIVQADSIGRIALKKLAWISGVMGVLIFGCLYFLGPVFAGWYGSEALPGLLLLIGATLLFSPLGAQRSALLRKTLRFNTLAKIEVISWTISFLVTSVLAFQGWNAWAMAMGFFSRNIVLTITSVICTPHKEEHEAATPDISAHLRYGFFDFTAHWAEFLANYLDKLIVGKWLGMEALGYYNLAFTFLMLPTARLASVVTRVSFPVFAQIKSKKRALQAFFEISTRDLSLVLFPVYAVLI